MFEETSEAEILIDQLTEEIAAAIGGTKDLYIPAATKIVGDIEEFSMVNWWIDVKVPGFGCTVRTDAGDTHIISPSESAS